MGIVLSPWKTRQIKGAMEIEHYKVFEQLKRDREAEKASEPSESAPSAKENTDENQAGSEDQESAQKPDEPL